MSSRLDVARSFLRSAAGLALTGFDRLHLGSSVRALADTLLRKQLSLPDGRLTAAIAKVPEVSAATVSTRDGQLRIDASFHDGGHLLLHLRSLGTKFATRGAKEWSVEVHPAQAALDPRCADIVVAIAGEIARTLWAPFLRTPRTRARSANAHRDGNVLIVDLRNVAEVRAALGQPLLAAAIDAFNLRGIEAEKGGLRLLAKF
ncbi:MAG TPA: hypothetical protein VJR89_31375 [Polyangiales bacterium]|nr:hypothetical protein [Polyangiales bacterium]